MFDAMEIRDEIEMATDNFKANMPENIRQIANLAIRDLHSGPVYMDDSGDCVSCFDEKAKPFSFESAVDEISKWAECINDVEMIEFSEDEDGDEIETEIQIDGSREAIIRQLFGKELATYL